MNPNPGRQNDREKKGTMAMKKKMYSRSSVPTPKRVRLIFLTALFMALIILYYSVNSLLPFCCLLVAEGDSIKDRMLTQNTLTGKYAPSSKPRVL